MGERYWTNDIIDPDEVATFGADCKGGANAFNSYWCDTPGHNAGQPGPRRAATTPKRQQMYSQIQQIVYDAVAVPGHRLQPVPVRRRRAGCTGSTRPRSATTTCPWRR